MSTVEPIQIRRESDPRRQRLGRLVSFAAFAAAMLSTAAVWNLVQRYPRTDDAYIRANTIGMAPRVYGQIVELPIRDNQFVQAGDLLYRIDPRPYEVALARAEANMAVVEFDVRALQDAVQVADAKVVSSRADVGRAEADVVRRAAEVQAAKARA
ncbi:MAG: biotin/lipoyl-binding protein, partial [Planctomycetes bacterium]|nr:biotin/lipoyl-binding protein [Planctomycetota bacterium]